MGAMFIGSAVLTVIPTLTLGFANGITALGLVLMVCSGSVLWLRNRSAQ